ncbi:NIPSNAP family protein [Bordetella genomosp. 4]|uniref:NIPSNAP family protein n=1 Tax=Bordetella genomosp. 4 TaxID=463044 RepID=A0A261TVA4_9BORD|nr:NIPSNAP family protein [Bordetella genomosp. 4]OZI53072.1 NIPSNAP family protein [Bordetella genomosp. 4]
MIIETRIYHCLPGRLPALHERFTRTTLDFFKKYGIKPIGFWTTLIGPSNHALTYLLEWESLEERERKWNAFQADPEWIAKRAASEAEKPIVERVENHILVPTDYSPMR